MEQTRNRRSRNSNRSRRQQWTPLTPQLAWQLAAPQTWAATIAAVAFSYVYATVAYTGSVNLLYALVLTVIAALMQSAVNVFDDYFDYRKGTDNLENSSEDAFDAVLVYNRVNPRSVLFLGIGYLAVAFALGVWMTLVSSWITLAIGIVGAIVVVIYAGGAIPLAHLPVGEVVSGFVMGGLIPLACCYVLSGVFDPLVLFYAIPIMIGIGMINATNNTCDIEKDAAVERKTLAVHLGRESAVRTYHIGIIVWLATSIICVAIGFTSGLPYLLLMLLGLFPILRALFMNPMVQESRTGAMAQIVSTNVVVTGFYCLAIMASQVVTWI